MQLVKSGKAGLAIGEDDFELAGTDGGTGRESPLGKIIIVVGQIKACESDSVGGGVIELHPRSVLPGAVGDAGKILGLHLSEPQRSERRQGSQAVVRSPRSKS